MLSTSKFIFIALLSLVSVSAMASKDGTSPSPQHRTSPEACTGTLALTLIVIVSFQKSASEADRESTIKELEQKGAKIVKDNNKHSSSESS